MRMPVSVSHLTDRLGCTGLQVYTRYKEERSTVNTSGLGFGARHSTPSWCLTQRERQIERAWCWTFTLIQRLLSQFYTRQKVTICNRVPTFATSALKAAESKIAQAELKMLLKITKPFNEPTMRALTAAEVNERQLRPDDRLNACVQDKTTEQIL